MVSKKNWNRWMRRLFSMMLAGAIVLSSNAFTMVSYADEADEEVTQECENDLEESEEEEKSEESEGTEKSEEESEEEPEEEAETEETEETNNEETEDEDEEKSDEEEIEADKTDLEDEESEEIESEEAKEKEIEEIEYTTFVVRAANEKNTYSLNDLEVGANWGMTFDTVLHAENQYNQITFMIPDDIDVTLLKEVEVLTEDNVGSMSVKLLSAKEPTNDAQLAVVYNTNKISTSGIEDKSKIVAFCIMSLSESAIDFNVTGVKFVLEENQSSSDTKEENCFDMSELNKIASWGVDLTDNEDGSVTYTYVGEYGEAYYEIPSSIDPAALDKIVVNTTDSSRMSIKFRSSDKPDSYNNPGEIAVVYGNNELSTSAITEGTPTHFGIMGLEVSFETTVKSVTFYLKDTGSSTKPIEVPEGSYRLDQLEQLASRNVDSEENENGSMGLTFQNQWAQIDYLIPEEIKIEKLERIIVTLYEGNSSNLCVKALAYDLDNIDAGFNELGQVYGGVTLAVPASRDGMNSFGIMNMKDAVTKASVAYVTFEMDTYEGPKGVEYDIPDLRDAMTEILGDGFYVGTAITGSEIYDENVMALVTKHFNAVTLGNELKPDAIFNYSNNSCPATQTITFHGQELVVPTLNFSRAEAALDKIYDWNQNHPEDFIKVRGHVLTWHSQTPEWFFHVDYDAEKDYVDKDTMSLRHEWYIKSVLEHFTGENSKYKDMFYGWDVVNEAVSDGRGTYRNASENSSWWAVYGSNEFIINAFRFANKYAPADLELYYNDYNEWVTSKVKGIAQLLQDVKDADGTRIDGMGMQGHYQTAGSPSMEDFKTAATTYAKIVDKIQITELDFKASSAYDGTSATEADENTRLAYRYKELYDTIQELRADGVNITNMTVWGVIDKNSWLQTSNSVGGASNGNQRQMPLLFNDYYRAKPAYWALVDANKLEPKIKSFDVLQGDDFANGNAITFGKNDTNVTITPVWSADGMKFQAVVADATVDAADEITVYLSANGKITSVTAKRAEGEATDTGYTVVKDIPCDVSSLFVTSQLKMDFVVTDGNNKIAYNDYTLSQSQKDDYYAKVLLKPFVVVPKGTVENLDGKADEEWDNAVEVPLTISLGAKATASAKLMWDEQNLYVFVEVMDAVLDAESKNAHEKDSLEVFIDENNGKTSKYEADDKQYRINYLNEHSFNGTKCKEENVTSEVVVTENGYTIEAAFAWTDINPTSETKIGLELQINDAEEGKRLGTLSWFDTTGSGWEKPGVFGTVLLQDNGSGEPVEPSNPTQPSDPVEPSNPTESNQSNDSQESATQKQPETKSEAKQDENVVIQEEDTPLADAIPSGYTSVEIKLGTDKILRKQSIAQYFGTKTILYCHLENLVGYTLNTNQLVSADVDLSTTKQILPLFAEGFETYVLTPKKEVALSFEIGMHVHVGTEYVGKPAYIYQKNLTTGQFELVSAVFVNEIGNVALLTNQLSQVMVLVQK